MPWVWLLDLSILIAGWPRARTGLRPRRPTGAARGPGQRAGPVHAGARAHVLALVQGCAVVPGSPGDGVPALLDLEVRGIGGRRLRRAACRRSCTGSAVGIVDGQFVSPPVFWRSSPRGVDLLAYVHPIPITRSRNGCSGDGQATAPVGIRRVHRRVQLRRHRHRGGRPGLGTLPSQPVVVVAHVGIHGPVARPVRDRRRHEHLRPGAVGVAPLRARSSTPCGRRRGLPSWRRLDWPC